jgi:hypothetical protein
MALPVFAMSIGDISTGVAEMAALLSPKPIPDPPTPWESAEVQLVNVKVAINTPIINRNLDAVNML